MSPPTTLCIPFARRCAENVLPELDGPFRPISSGTALRTAGAYSNLRGSEGRCDIVVLQFVGLSFHLSLQRPRSSANLHDAGGVTGPELLFEAGGKAPPP